MTRAGDRQEWRVRRWIRAAAVLTWLGLGLEQLDVIRRVNQVEMPSSEIRDGYVFLGALAVGVWLLAFRPRITLDSSGQVEVRNPLRKWRFTASAVTSVQPTSFGVGFTLADGRTPWSIVLQDTWARGEPRWFDVAEAVTGERPEVLPDDCDDDEDK